MPPSCSRCVSQRVINLETVRKLGVAAGALAGGLKGAYVSLYAPGRLIPPSKQFHITRLASTMIAAATGGMAGIAAGNRVFLHLIPSGEGTPWLCLGCGHAFRVLN